VDDFGDWDGTRIDLRALLRKNIELIDATKKLRRARILNFVLLGCLTAAAFAWVLAR
jgi:hypothetical protein